MRRSRWLVVLVLATFGGVRCSDTPWGPGTPETPAPPNTLPELIVSEALAPATGEGALGAGIAVPMAYVSLPPGTVATAVSVRIRNLTTGGEATAPEPIVDGGFDPVAVPASAGDRLALAFTDGSGGVREEYGTVPARRPPVVVRTAPPKGRTDVALSVRPVVVFSEPIDPTTLPVGMRLVTGGTVVSGRVELLAPWVAEFVAASSLEPGTRYDLEITQDVHDLTGIAIEAPLTVTFTTQTASEPFEPRIAFVRSTQPVQNGGPGPPSIYVARANGSRVTRLTSGGYPAWSPDGGSIAFVRGGQIRLINSDGSGERILALNAGYSPPGWSPDGTKIVYGSGIEGDISVLNVSSPGARTQLIEGDGGLFPASPQWSSDGRSISFISVGDWDFTPSRLFIANADGSNPRQLEVAWPPCRGVESCEYIVGPPSQQYHAWSPDGSRIAAVFRVYYPYTLTTPDRNAWALATFDGSGADPQIHFAEPGEGGANYLAHPTWSPDGRNVAFEKIALSDGCTPPACPMRIWVVSVEDGSARQLIPDTEMPEGPGYWDQQPAWSRAGD